MVRFLLLDLFGALCDIQDSFYRASYSVMLPGFFVHSHIFLSKIARVSAPF